MNRQSTRALAALFVGVLVGFVPLEAQAAPLSASVLPARTTFWFSVGQVPAFRDAWGQTEFGKLLADSALQPFVEALRERASGDGSIPPLGIGWNDILRIAGSEASIAVVPAKADPAKRQVTMLLVDTAGRSRELLRVMREIKKLYLDHGAALTSEMVNNHKLYRFAWNAGEPAKEQRRYYFSKGYVLGITEDRDLALEVIGNWPGDNDVSLARLPSFAAIAEAANIAPSPNEGEEQSEAMPSRIRWYFDPLAGRAETDNLKLLKAQGFDAIKAIGGEARLRTGGFDFVHRTVIYAPGELAMAARVLSFIPAEASPPAAWIPAEATSVLSVAWNYTAALAGYGSWFDATDGQGEEGTFDAVLEDMHLDSEGPQVDVRGELIGRFAGPVQIISLPGEKDSTKSQSVYAVKVNEPAEVAGVVRRLLVGDEDVEKPPKKIGDHEFWVYRHGDKDSWLGPNLSGIAIGVANDHLLVADSFALAERLLQPAEQPQALAEAEEFKTLLAGDAALGAESTISWQFSRPALTFAPTYAQLQAGEIQQSNAVVGVLLTSIFDLLAPRPAVGGKHAGHELPFDKLPEYKAVRPYLHPTRLHARQLEHGWQITGFAK